MHEISVVTPRAAGLEVSRGVGLRVRSVDESGHLNEKASHKSYQKGGGALDAHARTGPGEKRRNTCYIPMCIKYILLRTFKV